jgi:hypothetical protein
MTTVAAHTEHHTTSEGVLFVEFTLRENTRDIVL